VRDARVLALVLTIPMVATCRSRTHASDTGASSQSAPALAEDTMPDTAGCEIVAHALHPNPSTLITEFLRRDTTGDFTSSNAWDAGAHTCPGREAGWDTYTIVTGYRLVPLRSGTDTSQYQVTYQVYAEAVDDSLHEMRRAQAPEVDTFVVVRTPYGWRIDSPLIPPHISPPTTLRIMQIKNHDRAALMHLVARR